MGFGDIVNWIKLLPINTVDYIMGILVRISGFFANVAGALLDWVTSPSFISLPYTKAGSLADGGNPIIEVGLNITKNFVNLSLVIVLVFIALAITLRLEEYATRKTLVRLIIIALLVNFAPVIVGLIVDASNIVMNYFLVGIREGISGLLNDISGSSVTAVLTRPGTVKASYLLTKGLTLMILNLSIALIFLLFALIFIFRYVAIWILVILSPLAFVAWILPATKKIWDMWWKQLLNWCFIGIPLAFFLYLAMRSVAGLNTYFDTQITSTGLEPEELRTLNMVFPYFAVLAMLWFGFFIGLGTAALGSSAVVSFAKSRGGQIGRGAWSSTKWGARQARWAAQKTRAKLPEGVRRWGERQMGAAKYGAERTGVLGVTARALSTINPGRYLRRGAGILFGGTTTESEQTKIQAGEKTIKDTDTTPTILRKYHEALTDTRRIGILNKLIEKGDLNEAMDIKKYGASAIKTGEVEKAMAKARKIGADKNLKKAMPQFDSTPTKEDIAKGFNTKEKVIKDRISRMKPADYKIISKEALKDASVIDAILSVAMGKHISQLIEEHGRVAADALEKGISEGAGRDPQGRNPNDWLKATNPRLHKYLTTTAGAGLVTIPQRRIIITPPSEEKAPPVKPVKKEQKLGDTGEAQKRKRKEPDVGKK